MAAPTFTDRQRFRQMLAEIAAKAKTKLPESNGRVDKAVALVLAGDVEYLAEDGSARVASCTDPLTVYHVKGNVCDCHDWERAPQHLCKHVLSVMLTIRVQQVLASEVPQAQPLEDARNSLPEAPASVNLKV